MKDVYELVDHRQTANGVLIDVYEHRETGQRIEKAVGIDR